MINKTLDQSFLEIRNEIQWCRDIEKIREQAEETVEW